MCGIIAYIGEKQAKPILVNGLQRLEYRGYDSSGICIKKDNLILLKKQGKLQELKNEIPNNNLFGNIGIAHTRWATHGKPDEINAHPHLDCKNEIAIVHNGIIENYESLKKLLESEGHKIVSETDSEIISHLIERFYKGNFEFAVLQALNLLEGAFGIAVIHKDHNKIIAARRGSPLIIGIGKNEMFVASDVPAIIEYTNKVIYLKDNEVAFLTKDHYLIKNINGENVDSKIHEIKWNIEQIEKGNYEHFMLKEIFEQPQVLKNTMRGRIRESKVKISVNVDFSSLNKIFLVACGTSWHACLIGKYLIEELAQIPVEVDYASEFRYRNPILSQRDLVIAISQSGETADTLAAIKEAKNKNSQTMGIVNVVGSTITREVDSGIYLHAGPETGVASTKAFTSQVTALVLFALYARQQRGFEIDESISRELEELPRKITEILDKSEEIKNLAKKFINYSNFLYFGRGINFPVALEGALKLKEISYIHAEGYPSAEMKHGPIALIDNKMPSIFIATKNKLNHKIISNIQEVKARGGTVITIANKDEEIKNLSDYFIEIPETNEILAPILNSIPLQLFAYYVASLKGIDVDKPRNLAKSVTVE